MSTRTRPTWESYRASIGDRSPMFAALHERWDIDRALYAGSYVDLSPSTAIRSVDYVDLDVRARRTFADRERIHAELEAHDPHRPDAEVRFHHADYRDPLDIDDGSVDLVISLYAGLVSDHCRRYLRPGGLLLANTSHGDAAVVALDPTYDLVGVFTHRDGDYRLVTRGMEGFLVPKATTPPDAEAIRASGRGIAYTRTAFAYVFRAR
ncbi:class I SAM-dependent methyltransferase [Microbacterium aquimaris]|uniref:Class I SAM-dependent methyltransferase n=1 Tax=Microbacterium aquimaris TaxID=459816 RepID=A0ABU5N671_9MICO|nr:class I SAM-dependent methyltransferase [Microbacterium aquimaris]MDZ8161457.1 class I SAM-dependent methyltransferase [Microbacterium aquimaris]